MSPLSRTTLRHVSSTLSRSTLSQGAAFSTTSRILSRPTQNDSTDQQTQSVADRSSNFAQAAANVGTKIEENPQAVSSKDAAYLKSREARVTQQSQPPKDSISAEAERLAAENEGSTTSAGQGLPSNVDQSERDRVENFKQVEQDVGIKMDAVPEHVSKEEADLLRSRETRAFGRTEKGGAASQAQSLAAENEKKGTI